MSFTRREFLASIGGLAALLAPEASGAVRAPRHDVFAVSGNIFSEQGAILENHAVLMEGGWIKDVIPADAAGDVAVLAHPGHTILPGIVNCHIHRCHTPEDRRNRFLRHGITAVGDVASPLSALPALRRSPVGATATTACAGPMLCPPGGYPLPVHDARHGLVVTSPTHGRERVRQLADLGAIMIKTAMEPGPYSVPWPMFDAATLHAIGDEAHRLDLVPRCHMEDFGGLATALDAGIRVIDHVPHRWLDRGRKRSILRGGVIVPEYRKQLERMVRDGVTLTPTLDVLSRSVWNGPELYEPVRAFAAMGGRIAVGNDYPYRRTDAGMPLKEIELLGKTGLEAPAILTSATRTSSAACGFNDRGLLKPGMRADLIVVTGNPTVDLTTMARVRLVIKDGMLVR